jgi:hypothetical protein
MRETTGRSLQDFPLRGEPAIGLADPFPAPAHRAVEQAAPLSARATAAAADGAALLLVTALAILGARLVTGASPRLPGLVWAGGFLICLSFFATVPSLVVFGRTIGMALADLTVSPASGPRISAADASRRWVATLATAATAGLTLLWTARDAASPTLADRLSGCPLTLD